MVKGLVLWKWKNVANQPGKRVMGVRVREKEI